MEMTNTTFKLTQTIQSVLSNHAYTVLMGLMSASWMCLSALGVIGNIINIKTFISTKLDDGMTLAFLVLSFSDLGFLFIMFAVGASSIFYVVEMQNEYRIWFPVEPYGTSIIFASTGVMLYVLTELTTTYVSVARCMCVARPLHFKNTFTRRTTLVCALAFVLCSVGSCVPIVATMGIKRQFDYRVNTSRLMLWVAPNRDAIKHGVWSLTDIFLPLTTQTIVLVCLIIMADKLRKSLKFRKTFKSSDETKENKPPRSNNMVTNKKTSSDVPKKDMKVVKQVMLISVVYIVCNTPKIFINITSLLVSDFTLGTRYQNLYLVLNSIRSLFETVNSSASLPIYYTYNGKFRKLKSQNRN